MILHSVYASLNIRRINKKTSVTILKMIRIKRPSKKAFLIIVAVFAVAATACVYVYRQNKNDQAKEITIPAEAKAEHDQIIKKMQEATVKDSLDPGLMAEIDSSISANKLSEAKQQIGELLKRSDLTEVDKKSLYDSLARVCLKMNDFGCIDEVLSFQKSQDKTDVFYLVDAARAAKKAGQIVRSQAYYKTAFDIIQSNGGKEYADKLSASSQTGLDYQEIKSGSGQ